MILVSPHGEFTPMNSAWTFCFEFASQEINMSCVVLFHHAHVVLLST